MANSKQKPIFPMGLDAQDASVLNGFTNTGIITHDTEAIMQVPVSGDTDNVDPSAVRYNAESDEFEGSYSDGWRALGGGGIRWEQGASTNNTYNPEVGRGYFIDSRNASAKVILPSAPKRIGLSVSFADLYGSLSVHPMSIDANGKKIYGGTDPMVLSTDNAAFTLTWTGEDLGWIVTNAVGIGSGRTYRRNVYETTLTQDTNHLDITTVPEMVDIFVNGARIPEAGYTLVPTGINFTDTLRSGSLITVLEYKPFQLMSDGAERISLIENQLNKIPVGFVLQGRSFVDGFTITDRLTYGLSSDGVWYQWNGALPKTVAAGSNPTTTGGIAANAWQPVGDYVRAQLATTAGDTLVKNQYNLTLREQTANSTPIYIGANFESDANTQVNISVSYDGAAFKKISETGLWSADGLGSVKGRDPSIIYHKGWWMIAVTGYAAGSHDAVIWRSRNLSKWEKVLVKFGQGVLGTSLTGSQVVTDRIWAPEWVLDNDNLYLLSSFRYYNDAADVTGATIPSFKPYYTKCTDIETLKFDAPVAVNIEAKNIIDPVVIINGSQYYMIIKDERTKVIQVYSATGLMNAFTKVSDVTFSEFAEGPSVVQLPDGKYRIYADYFATKVWSYYVDTADFLTFTAEQPLKYNGRLRHGTFKNVQTFQNPPKAIGDITALYSVSNNVGQAGQIPLRTDAGTNNINASGLSWFPKVGATYYSAGATADDNITINQLPRTYPDGAWFNLIVKSRTFGQGDITLKSSVDGTTGASLNGIGFYTGDFVMTASTGWANKLIRFESWGGVWIPVGLDTRGTNLSIESAGVNQTGAANGSQVDGGAVQSRLIHSSAANGAALMVMGTRAVVGAQDFGYISYRNWAGNFNQFNFLSTGNATAPGSWVSSSDKRIKSDYTPIENALDKLLKLTGYIGKKDGEKFVGFLAQDVQEVLPEAVDIVNPSLKLKTGEVVENVLGVSYGEMGALYVNAMKDMHELIVQQKAQIEDMQKRLDELEGK